MTAELDALRAHLQATPDGHCREVLAKAVARIEALEAELTFRETQLALREMAKDGIKPSYTMGVYREPIEVEHNWSDPDYVMTGWREFKPGECELRCEINGRDVSLPAFLASLAASGIALSPEQTAMIERYGPKD